MLERPSSTSPFVAAFAAAVVGALFALVIYQELLIPRLPRYHAVPLAWWLLVTSPVVIAVLLPAFRWPRQWLGVAASATGGVLLVMLTVDLVEAWRGRPVAHDTFFASWDYLRMIVIQAAILFVGAVLLARLGAAASHLRRSAAVYSRLQ